MANDAIERIKASADCVALFKRFWSTCWRERGNCVCPWHKDSPERPSLSVDRVKAHCFAEGKSWDAIDLYREGMGCSKSEAIRALSLELGITPAERPRKGKGKPGLPQESDPEKVQEKLRSDWKVLSSHELPEEALSYLTGERKLGPSIEALKKKRCIGYDKRSGGIAFPVTDWKESTLYGIQTCPVGSGEKRFKAGSKTEKGMLRISNGGDHLVVSEGVFDAMAIYDACCRELFLDSVSLYSANGWKKVGDLPGNPVLFFDADWAGYHAACRCLKSFWAKVALIDYELLDGWGKDPNDILRCGRGDLILQAVKSARRPADEAEAARWIEGLLERLRAILGAVPEEDTEERKKLSDDMEKFEREMRSENPPKRDGEPSLEERLSEINATHAIVMLGGKCCVMNEYTDPVFGRNELSFSSVADFRNYYDAERYSVSYDSPPRSIGRIWLSSKNRRQYRGIVFSPQKDVPDHYNMWKGFAIEPRQGDWSLFKSHIFNVIACGNIDVFRYLMAWMAHGVQQPGGKRPGTCIVLRGDQGTGKSLFVKQFGYLFGSHFLHITNQYQITGRFNNHLKNALIVFIDEGIWAGDKHAEGVLKGMITEDMIAVEPKGKDVFMVENHVRLLIASNNEWVVPAGIDERRFFVLDVDGGSATKQNASYFEPIFQQMDNGGREAFLYDLLQVELEGFNLRSFPRTGALADQIIHSMGSVEKFWLEKLQSGFLRFNSGEWEQYVTCKDLYTQYTEFCKTTGERYPDIQTHFGKNLRKLCPKLRRKRFWIENAKIPVLTFPDLEQCRNLFENVVNFQVEWDEVEAGAG